jgi:hypothetical protein
MSSRRMLQPSSTILDPPTPLIRKPQDAKSRNKERTARGHQLCYFLVEMNVLTESANGEGNAIKENNIIDALWRCVTGRTAGRRAVVGPWLEDPTPLKLAELIEREFGGFVPPKMFDD